MKKNIKYIAAIAVVAIALPSIGLFVPNAQAEEKSTTSSKLPSLEIEGIELPSGALTFNWPISNKVIRPKR